MPNPKTFLRRPFTNTTVLNVNKYNALKSFTFHTQIRNELRKTSQLLVTHHIYDRTSSSLTPIFIFDFIYFLLKRQQ